MFDEQPDGDPHAECRHEIESQAAEIARLQTQVKQADGRGDDAMRRAHAAEAECEALRAAGAELERAEAHYRLTFQIAPSTAHLDVGRAWDRMEKAGDAMRAALAAQPKREPLTDDDITRLAESEGWHIWHEDILREALSFARGIERLTLGEQK